MNQYECASIALWDARGRTMHTIFFGGISRGFTMATRAQDDGLPFSNDVSMVSYRSSASTPYQETVLCKTPGGRYLGADARFIVNAALVRQQLVLPGGVIQLDALPSGSRQLVGYIYGGIESPDAQPLNTFGSNTVFQVWIDPSPSTAVAAGA